MSTLGIVAAGRMTTVASREYGPVGSGVDGSGPETGARTHHETGPTVVVRSVKLAK